MSFTNWGVEAVPEGNHFGYIGELLEMYNQCSWQITWLKKKAQELCSGSQHHKIAQTLDSDSDVGGEYVY